MQIKLAHPPNFAAILKVFPSACKPGVLFTYGDTIFNPSVINISAALLAHEAVHSGQQLANAAGWWRQYLEDPRFRFEQELEAHRAEVERATLDQSGRLYRRRYIASAAERLSSPLYGRMCSKAEAVTLLKSAATIGAAHVE